jgi:DNA-binding CsgD family transcriptional regulator
MPSADPLRIIEAGYAWNDDESAWLDDVLDASVPYDQGRGLMAWTVDLSRRPRITGMAGREVPESAHDRIHGLVAGLSGKAVRALFSPIEIVGNAQFRMARLVDQGLAAREVTAPVPPMWALVGGDGATRAVIVGFLAKPSDFEESQAFPRSDRKLLGLVGAHLGAALRLRDAARPTPDDAATEAVLSPEGRVLDASGVAKTEAPRRTLAEAVIQSERARGRLRRTAPEEAVGLWQALVMGRWSIVEIVERDGKRMLLARKNVPGNPDVAALTKEESDVVWLAARGHSYKYIGYELGFPEATIVRRLNRAMRKLRVRSRRDLLKKLGQPEG